jgi:hypothetical protein
MIKEKYFKKKTDLLIVLSTACSLDICLYLTPVGQTRQFMEICGPQNALCGRQFVYFWADLFFSAQAAQKTF